MTRHNPILNLLADGRIDVAEAERLLQLSAAATVRQQTLAWLPVFVMAAILLLQNPGALESAAQFLTIRAAELARLEHFHLLLNR